MITKTEENINIPMVVDVPYDFAAGRYLARALTALRDEGKLYGVKCPKCGRIQLPARIVCAECLVKNEEWIDLPLEGALTLFTVNYLPMTDPTTGAVKEPPSIFGNMQFDGTDIGLSFTVNADPNMTENLWVGMRVRMVMKPDGERKGDLSDFLYMEPVPGQVRPEKA